MNVKVITRHGPSNYGSLLQSIATQKVLGNLGHYAQIINYQRRDERGIMATFTQAKQKFGNNWLKIAIYTVVRFPLEIASQFRFDKMRKQFLNLTERYYDKDSLSQIKSEVLMTGSDQVWGPLMNGKIDEAYFLNFAKAGVKKIAYAASFGRLDFSTSTKLFIKEKLDSYDKIAVREKSAVSLLNELDVSNCGQVLDPTLLLDYHQWDDLIGTVDCECKEYILVYQIHNNPRLDVYAKEFSKVVNIPIIRVSPSYWQKFRGGDFVFCPTLERFLGLIKHSKFIVTDSFHGTAFAINYNKDFIEILPNTGTSTRNQSILELLGLTDRIVIKDNDFSFVSRGIDYVKVNAILASERLKSLQCLQNMINS